jgi:hypothetical protein
MKKKTTRKDLSGKTVSVMKFVLRVNPIVKTRKRMKKKKSLRKEKF